MSGNSILELFRRARGNDWEENGANSGLGEADPLSTTLIESS